MKNHEKSSSTPELLTLPYLYGRQTDSGAPSRDQQVTLFPPGTAYVPELEELKMNDPDSYRMVVYSWG